MLRALDTAAEADTATGGVDRNGRIFPVIKIITAEGIETITDDVLRELFNAGRRAPNRFPQLPGLRAVSRIGVDRRPAFAFRNDSKNPSVSSRPSPTGASTSRTQIASGSPVAAFNYAGGILLFTLGRERQKIFEIYDRIALAAIGHPGDIERLRMTAIELASTEGFTRSANDVSLRRMANYSISPALKAAFEQVYGAPYLARMLFVELGAEAAQNTFMRVDYDGAIQTNGTPVFQDPAGIRRAERFACLGGGDGAVSRARSPYRVEPGRCVEPRARCLDGRLPGARRRKGRAGFAACGGDPENPPRTTRRGTVEAAVLENRSGCERDFPAGDRR